MPPSRNVLTIGHGTVKSLVQIPYEDEENELVNFPDVALFSCMRQLLLTGAHATISRKPDDSFVIFDDGRFETLVNYERIVTEVALKEKDVICFGHPFDATIQPGVQFSAFPYDLKFKVHICQGANRHEVQNPACAKGETHQINLLSGLLKIGLSWLNRPLLDLLYLPSEDPQCVQLLKLIEPRQRVFPLNLEPSMNKYLQFLIVHSDNYTHNHILNYRLHCLQNSFRRLVNFMNENSINVVVEYEFRPISSIQEVPGGVRKIYIGRGRPRSENQVLRYVIVLADPLEDWFENIFKSVLPPQAMIICVFQDSESANRYQIMSDFLQLIGPHLRFLLYGKNNWVLWCIRRDNNSLPDLQEMHIWFAEIYQKICLILPAH